jgi:hypothetical protein
MRQIHPCSFSHESLPAKQRHKPRHRSSCSPIKGVPVDQTAACGAGVQTDILALVGTARQGDGLHPAAVGPRRIAAARFSLSGLVRAAASNWRPVRTDKSAERFS